ncbi:olfactory receptor 10AD1-like [Suricata suricatta]|uniref:olfactory receptor 10AD1-like n=1 Tax=Suricata suricatta TaxID=37032 RepID=UPI001155ECDC|nr:olfactory receptor 10AD1-like [Suricata suricatta]
MVDLRNGSTVTEFILVGFEQSSSTTRALLFALFLALYSLAMAMNGLIIFITWTDPRLNSPMYFFLGHLSFLDVCFITTTIPQMLIHLVVKNHSVSFASCLTQMYLVFGVGVAECILLAFMAYDRYVAICHPLSYAQIMSRQVCVKLVSTAWFFGLINGILLDYMTFRGPFCRDNHIENFFCEAPIVIALSCGDPQFSLRMIFADAIVVLLSPMVLIVISYARILASILGRASSSELNAYLLPLVCVLVYKPLLAALMGFVVFYSMLCSTNKSHLAGLEEGRRMPPGMDIASEGSLGMNWYETLPRDPVRMVTLQEEIVGLITVGSQQ